MKKRPVRPLPAFRSVLESVADAREDEAARVANDPLGLVRRYRDPRDQEVVGVLCAALAYGRVSLFLPILEELLRRLGPSPAKKARSLARDSAGALALASGLSYRMTRPRDIAELVRILGHAQARAGTLEELFRGNDDPASEDLAPALAGFRDALLREAPEDIERGRIGLERHLPDVKKGSAAKRLWLYLRWMVRTGAPDLGAWTSVSPVRLLIPLDAHIFRFARALGMTGRSSPDLRTAREVTAALRLLDPADPVRFDFHLCHLGMEEGCKERRDDEVCGPCALRPACVLYNGPSPRRRDRSEDSADRRVARRSTRR